MGPSQPKLDPSQVAEQWLNCLVKAAASGNHLMSVTQSTHVQWAACVVRKTFIGGERFKTRHRQILCNLRAVDKSI